MDCIEKSRMEEQRLMGGYQYYYWFLNNNYHYIFTAEEFLKIKEKAKWLSYFEMEIINNLVMDAIVLRFSDRNAEKKSTAQEILKIKNRIINIIG